MKSSRSSKKTAMLLEDIRLRVAVREVPGIIHAEMGVPCFYSEEESLVIPITTGVSSDYYGTAVSALIRVHSGEIVTQMLGDDYMVDDFTEEDIDAADTDMLHSMLIDHKLRLVPHVAYKALGCVVCGIASILLGIFKQWVWIALPALVLIVLVTWMKPQLAVLNCNTVKDRFGRYIDLETGETNLNKVRRKVGNRKCRERK